MDNLTFLDGDEPEQIETVEPQQEAQPPQVEEQQPEPEAAPVRDERGRFAPKGKEGDEGPIMVPLAALQEVRDELKALKAAAQPQSQPQQAPPPPDMFVDPEGYTAFQNQQISAALYSERFNTCLRFGVIQHGSEAVEEAVKWAAERANQDPHFQAAALAQTDPVEFAVQQYKREKLVSQVDDSEYEQFKAWKAAQAQAQQQPAQSGHASATPPQSIASLPSSGGAAHVPSGPGQAFDTLFKQ